MNDAPDQPMGKVVTTVDIDADITVTLRLVTCDGTEGNTPSLADVLERSGNGIVLEQSSQSYGSWKHVL